MSGKKIVSRLLAALLTVTFLFLGYSSPALYAEDNAKTLVINEVESSDPAGGNDWVELYNNSNQDMDISGWILSDDKGLARLDDGTTTPFPNGTIIKAGKHLVFDVDAVPYNFGLGKNDEVNLYDQDKNIVDTASYTGHATDTLGRYPDGTGAFVETLSTKGAANKQEGTGGSDQPGLPGTLTSKIKINEV